MGRGGKSRATWGWKIVRPHKDSWSRKGTDCSPNSVENTGESVRRAKRPRRMISLLTALTVD